MFKVLDLFSGIGGFSLGLERTGFFKTICFVEIDNYCQRVLHKHWPEVYIRSDIRTLTARHFDGYQRPDVICGGFPCQDISQAGRGEGLAGARSGLWSEMFRLVCELRPRYLVVENVAALLGRGLGRVLGDLASCGYDAEWDCIPAASVGAPHLRDRIWIVAYPNSNSDGRDYDRRALPKLLLRESESRSEPGELRPDVAYANGQRLQAWNETGNRRQESRGVVAGSESLRVYAEDSAKQWEIEPAVGRVVDGVPDRSHRIKALGNSIVPQIATWIGERIVEAECQ
jgi:DNA (cytosine-5)-methyltransferase 1